MNFDDLSDDDFVEIPRFRARPEISLLMRMVQLGRQATRRVQFTFQPSVLAEIGGPRYRVAFAPAKLMFRVQTDERGAYEAIKAGRSDKLMIRCEVPALLVHSDAVEEPEHYVDAIGKAILIEVPKAFLRAAPPPPRLAAPATSPATAAPAGMDPTLAATLGLTATFPRRIGTAELTPSEARILEVLYRRERASQDALMMATADDVDDDDRDKKIIDIMISKLRKKLEPVGVEISTIRGEGFAMAAGAKRFLAKLIGEAP